MVQCAFRRRFVIDPPSPKTFVDGIANLKRKVACAKARVQADLALITKWWKEVGKRLLAVRAAGGHIEPLK